MGIQETILDQINSTDRRAMLAWGAKDLKGSGTSLFFKVNGPKFSRGWIEVEYKAGPDTYTVKAFKMYKGHRKMHKEIDDVYCDSLVQVIDGIVG